MIEKITQLFRICYPNIVRAEDSIRHTVAQEDNKILTRFDGDKLIGAAVYYDDHILLLCVLPEYRGRGIGSELLNECEDAIRGAGYSAVYLSAGRKYLTPGAPMVFPHYENNRAFFEKRGYVHTWGEGKCVDMMLNMADLDDLGVHLGDTVPGVSKKEALDPDDPKNRFTYRFAAPEDMEKTADCVQEAADYFVRYYQRRHAYEGKNGSHVLIAENGEGLICGALLVTEGGEAPGLGSVGCTSTRKSFAGRGIATNMVKAGTMFLKEQGMTQGYLGYTYTEIIPMYARAGYAVSMEYFMGEKKFS
ncbi:MAG: GNAT family N-acetyltransferase [Clostridia bacterium]|nr:GNAT family N-acetyltransferase [Clostridia bacterium]